MQTYDMVAAPSNRRPDPLLSDSIWEMFSMKGKVVSITGGGGAIGFEVARAMAEVGADVAIWYDSVRIGLIGGIILRRKPLITLRFSRRPIMSRRRRINVRLLIKMLFGRQLS